jgi:uncharacterized membrane protein YfcA
MLALELIALGVVAGAATTASGIGWGVLTMPVLLGFLRFEPAVAVTLSVVASFGYTTSMLAVRSALGDLPVASTVALTLGSFVGGVLGALLLPVLPPLFLKRAIAGAIVVLGLIALVRS